MYLSKSNVEQGKAKAEAQEAFQPRLPRYSFTKTELWITDSKSFGVRSNL